MLYSTFFFSFFFFKLPPFSRLPALSVVLMYSELFGPSFCSLIFPRFRSVILSPRFLFRAFVSAVLFVVLFRKFRFGICSCGSLVDFLFRDIVRDFVSYACSVFFSSIVEGFWSVNLFRLSIPSFFSPVTSFVAKARVGHGVRRPPADKVRSGNPSGGGLRGGGRERPRR